MIKPEYGKVLVIDDNYNEALPLIKLLSKIEVPHMYFSGKRDELPENPFNGIRVVFLDLQLTTSLEPKTVKSSVLGVMKKLIHPNNGPFIIILWSTNETNFKEIIENHLKQNGLSPEYVLPLDKGEYFEKDDYLEKEFRAVAEKHIDEDSKNIINDLCMFLFEKGCFDKSIANSNALKDIENKLKEQLEEADLFSLFVLWENTISRAKTNTVNELYSQIPNTVDSNKRLGAMLHTMAYYQLEQAIDDMDKKEEEANGEEKTEIIKENTETKFCTAINSLNELCLGNILDESNKLDQSMITDLKISRENLIDRGMNKEKLNSLIMTRKVQPNKFPGNIYNDKSKLFQPHNWICGKKTKQVQENLEKYNQLDIHKHIVLEISPKCDVAQKRRFNLRIIPGIIMLDDVYMENRDKIFKGKSPDNIIVFQPIELKDDNTINKVRLIFNLNMVTFYDINSINDEDALIALRERFLVNIQTELGKLLSRQGVANF